MLGAMVGTMWLAQWTPNAFIVNSFFADMLYFWKKQSRSFGFRRIPWQNYAKKY